VSRAGLSELKWIVVHVVGPPLSFQPQVRMRTESCMACWAAIPQPTQARPHEMSVLISISAITAATTSTTVRPLFGRCPGTG